MTFPPFCHLWLGWQVCCKSNCHCLMGTLSFLWWLLILPNFNFDALRCLSWESRQQEGERCLNSQFQHFFFCLPICGVHRCTLPALKVWSQLPKSPTSPPYHAPHSLSFIKGPTAPSCENFSLILTRDQASVRWVRNPGVQFEEALTLRCHPCTQTTLGVKLYALDT